MGGKPRLTRRKEEEEEEVIRRVSGPDSAYLPLLSLCNIAIPLPAALQKPQLRLALFLSA